MPNMSYCRFENTSHDLQDCVNNWDSVDTEEPSWEGSAKSKIINLAKDILSMEGYKFIKQ